jgi:mRNA interferase MazF
MHSCGSKLSPISMPMSRGDLVIVAAPGDYGKLRPAVVVQSNAIPESHASVVICPMTSELAEADFRITIEPGPATGLRARCQVMADKPVTVRRERIGQRIGQLGAAELAQLNVALALVTGLAD